MEQDQLTISVVGKDDCISIASFLTVVQNTIAVVRGVDDLIAAGERSRVRWNLSRLSHNSPAQLGVCSHPSADLTAAREVVLACAEGIRQLELEEGVMPRYFNYDLVERTKSIVAVLNDGIEQITVSTPWSEPISPTQHLAAHADALLPREREALGSVRGRLQTLTRRRGDSFTVWDEISGRAVKCVITEEMLPEARDHFDHRVVVHGVVQYDRSGQPTHINVQRMRWIKEPESLPSFADLEGINLTDGVDAVEYVRGLRDE